MKITVNKDNVKIEEFDIVHEGEHRVNKCSFSFSEDFTEDLVKKAIFTLHNDSIEVPIINNECDIPGEILKARNIVLLGVYAYKITGDKLDLRYSPSPDAFKVNSGSYIEGVSESQEITSSQFEQYMQALNDGLNKVEESLKEIDEVSSSATQLVNDINQKLENGDFIGPQGPQGVPGKDGVGITTITSGQSTVEEDKTVTPVTVQKSDGSSQIFNVEAKNGTNGITPNLQIGTVTTLEPNQNATVTRTGTDEEPLFNFGIPKGQQGEKGQDGQPGQDGKDATINGQNTVKITTDNNITLDQQEIVLKLGLNRKLIPPEQIEGTDNTFEDGMECPLLELSGDGKSEQVTTNGKQLIDFYNPTSKSSYVSYSFENDILVVSNTEGSYQKVTFALGDLIKNNQGKKICFTYDNFLYEGDTMTNLVIVDDSGTHYNALITSLGNKLEYTIPEDTSNIISSRIEINSNNSSTPQLGKITITKPLIYFGELNNPPVYEQYSNGIPSPSPDYPQEINSIEGSLEFACRGKNLLRIKDLTEKVINGVTISIKNNEIFLNGIVSESGNPYITQVYTKNLKGTYSVKLFEKNPVSSAFRIYLKDQNDEEIISLTNLDNKYTKYINSNMTNLSMYFNQGTVFSNYKLSIMLVEGDKIPTSYEPYVEPNEVTFNLNDEKLRSVGDVKDELVVDLDTGDYYKVENVGQVTLTGQESNWYHYRSAEGSEVNTYSVGQNFPGINATNINSMSDKFLGVSANTIYTDDNESIAIGDTQMIIRINKSLANSVEEFKQWLSTHNTIVDYILQKSTTKKLGTLSTEDLAKLKTFKGYNNVTINTNLGLMTIRFTYGLDIKKYVDNKIAEISSAVIEEG